MRKLTDAEHIQLSKLHGYVDRLNAAIREYRESDTLEGAMQISHIALTDVADRIYDTAKELHTVGLGIKYNAE